MAFAMVCIIKVVIVSLYVRVECVAVADWSKTTIMMESVALAPGGGKRGRCWIDDSDGSFDEGVRGQEELGAQDAAAPETEPVEADAPALDEEVLASLEGSLGLLWEAIIR
jgi:hypothetical protein